MPRGRPKKGIAIKDETPNEEAIEIKIEVHKDEPSFTHCHYCKRELGEEGGKCAKGDHNQFKFCSIKCFNFDDRKEEFHYKP